MAVPAAIMAAAVEVKSSNLAEPQRADVVRHLERYFAKMDQESPFAREERQFMGIDEVKELDDQGLETALRRGVTFSKGAARLLSSTLRVCDSEDVGYVPTEISRIVSILDECKRIMRSGRVFRS